MKNCWTLFFLPVLLASTLVPVMAEPIDSDNVSQRAHRRAELRSALSAPVPRTERTAESGQKTTLHEHQLSAHERADMRRQLREQFRSFGFDAPQGVPARSATADVNIERPD